MAGELTITEISDRRVDRSLSLWVRRGQASEVDSGGAPASATHKDAPPAPDRAFHAGFVRVPLGVWKLDALPSIFRPTRGLSGGAPGVRGGWAGATVHQPDAPFYINIMQGLLYSMNADAAEEIYRWLQKRCPCRPGSYAPLNRALKKLADLKVLLAARAPAQSAPNPITALWSRPLVMIDQDVSHRRRQLWIA
ncbi:hypothetical protein BJ912DRAFT_1147609 [Pholiota molesta]|nr:hypothetical protein BJ912DRAFT_1147609 [Pholiota molesta]